jgi:hypothetical protein
VDGPDTPTPGPGRDDELPGGPRGVPGWVYALVLVPLGVLAALACSEPARASLDRRLPLVPGRRLLVGILGVTAAIHGLEAVVIGRRAARAGLDPRPWAARTLLVGSLVLPALERSRRAR